MEFKIDTNKQYNIITLFERIDRHDMFQSNMFAIYLKVFGDVYYYKFHDIYFGPGILHPDFRRWWFPGDFFCGPWSPKVPGIEKLSVSLARACLGMA